MPTTTDYLEDLVNQRNALAENISAKGVSASESEKLNSLVPKVNDVYEKGKEDGRDINPSWTSWGYFSANNNRNDVLKKLRFNDTSNGTDFSYMFYKCTSLTEVPFIDTSNGTTFNYMFFTCTSLTEVPFIDTSKGTDFGRMFYNCPSLTKIPSINTSKGTNFDSIFYNCKSLTEIPLIDTSKGTDLSSMFYGCTSLVTVPLIDGTSSRNFSGTFSNCSNLRNLKIKGTIKINGFNLASCTLLTHDSLMSVINALADKSSETTITWKVTLGTDNLAKLTDEEKAIATNRNWTLV
ncbi:MAG: leucine-rich repeat protein [Clostridiales bacterium]|nr:leucine-rich repeat protein [Clostridiales bacterium]